MRKNFRSSILAVLFVAFLTLGCDPSADHVLSKDEKIADMLWLKSIFTNNYAPMDWKKKLHGTDFEAINKKYMNLAKRTKNNEEFYQLLFRYVAEFQDAHTAASVGPADVPGAARMAYLGVEGVRHGEAFRVTQIMPTIDPSSYPLQIGDEITKIDGVPLFEYIDKHLTPYRNVGNSLANKTMHMQDVFTRISLMHEMPSKPNVKLTVRSAPALDPNAPLKTVDLPWITHDLHDFKIQLGLAKAAANPNAKTLPIVDPKTQKHLELAVLDQNGKELPLAKLLRNTVRGEGILSGFKVQMPVAVAIRAPQADVTPLTPMQRLAKERAIPANAISIDESQTYPAYIYSVGKKHVGYIRIDTFEPSGSEDAVIAELKATLAKFKGNGVNNVILDTIDNPGGSMSLMSRMTQLFTTKKIKLTGMQFVLNDNWLLELQKDALTGSDHLKELYGRLYASLREEKNQGHRLSKVYNSEVILPYTLQQSDGVDFDNIYILTSEMNASCGDIFPATMQDNKIAKIVGVNTMGAGGNVVDHSSDQAPNSHLSVRQTESLVVRKDGSYIENVGVKPDFPIDLTSGPIDQYATVRGEVEKLITAKPPKRVLAAGASCADAFQAVSNSP